MNPLTIHIETDEAETSEIKTETLLRATSSWNNVAYQAYPAGVPEIAVLKITIPAKCVLRWHEHPMPTAAYVLSGEITVEESDGKTQHFTAGQVILSLLIQCIEALSAKWMRSSLFFMPE